MMKFLSLILSLLLTHCASAQTEPNIEWQKTLGGSDADAAAAVQRTADGGYVVTGFTQSNNGDVTGNHGQADYWVVKLNAEGVMQWQKTLGGSGFDEAESLRQTADAGYIVVGESPSVDGDVTGNHGGEDAWVVKLDSIGSIQWQRSLGGSLDDAGVDIRQTADGGYILAAAPYSTDGDITNSLGGPDFWVVKLDANGNLQWQKSLGGSGNDVPHSIQQCADGGYIVAGETSSTDGDVTGDHGSFDYWVVKLDANGEIQWQKALGGSGDDEARSVEQTSDGGFVVAGFSNSTDGDVSGNHGEDDMWIVKLDTAGSVQWQQSLGGSLDDAANGIQQLGNGGYIVAGGTQSQDGDVTANNGNRDVWLVRLNTQGTLLWQKTMGGSSNDTGEAIALTDEGGYVVAGYADSNDGDVTYNHGARDFWVVKLGPDNVGIPELQDPAQFSLYPNPSTSAVNIELDLKAAAAVRLQLYDGTGKLVATVLDEKASAGAHSIRYSTADLPAGLYELRLTAGGSTMTRRLVKE